MGDMYLTLILKMYYRYLFTIRLAAQQGAVGHTWQTASLSANRFVAPILT